MTASVASTPAAPSGIWSIRLSVSGRSSPIGGGSVGGRFTGSLLALAVVCQVIVNDCLQRGEPFAVRLRVGNVFADFLEPIGTLQQAGQNRRGAAPPHHPRARPP